MLQRPFKIFCGGAVGVILGVIAALVFADPICKIFGVTSFEGASGFFIVFLVVPTLAFVGGVIGVIIGVRVSRPPDEW